MSGYTIIPADRVGHVPRAWVRDEAAGRRIIDAGIATHVAFTLHGFSREFTGETDCTHALVIDLGPFAIVSAREADGRRASYWRSFHHAYECAVEASRRGMLITADARWPGAAWAVVDTRFDGGAP